MSDNLIEAIGFITGILYLLCEIRQYGLMWALQVLSGVMYAVIFSRSGLYAAAVLQVYYIVISVYGIFQWRKGKRELENIRGAEDCSQEKSFQEDPSQKKPSGKEDIFYRYPSAGVMLASLGVLIVLTGLFATVLKQMTGDPMPLADAMATALSIIANYWLSKSYIQQWLMWVAVNVITVFLSFSQELYLTSVLYIIYTFAAIYGYFHWKARGRLLS